ncbi:MAG: hypothetical protein WBA74_10450 [Cyclobacteriaceae bacterium]
MATYTRLLVPRKQAENVQTTQYTAGDNSKIVIDKFTVTNTGITVETISVNLPANGQAVLASNLVSDARKISPGETYTFPELTGQVIDSGGYISTLASLAAVLTISVSGREIVQ